jgi:hypothetical protein
MELEGSLHRLKQPATCPDIDPVESGPLILMLFFKNNFNIILHLRYLFPSGYFIRTQYAFIPTPH